jgi:hypothetical protein
MEVLFVAGLAVVVGAAAAPQMAVTIDEVRAAGAVRFMSTRLHRVRMEAIARSTDVAIQFSETPKGYSWAVYVDGNGNGVRTTEIQEGVDERLTPTERLSDHFTGIDFGVLPGLPAVESGSEAPGSDPIKLGPGSLLTFGPSGTSSSGSLYVRGRQGQQYVIRVFGETAKTRLLRFDPRNRQWRPR